MNEEKRRRTEFGDWQTPYELALACCRKLAALGIAPDVVVEPTCGTGAFVLAAGTVFTKAQAIHGYEFNAGYLDELSGRIAGPGPDPALARIRVHQADFFQHDWATDLARIQGRLLVLGNFPWVTNSQQGTIGGINLPVKSNFQGHAGFDAMTGKANFDISEWMLLKALSWFHRRAGAIGMLVKTAVARKVLAQAQQQAAHLAEASMFGIDAKRHFGAAVDACLLVMRFDPSVIRTCPEYTVYKGLDSTQGSRVGHRDGMTVGDLDAFDATLHLVGKSPQKWRSGVKHDASAVMEFERGTAGFVNGLGETLSIEDVYAYPLLKGSDIGSNKPWRQKFVLVTQRFVGENTAQIEALAPLTWHYLLEHAPQLDTRGSSIYARTPRFAVFGIGDYAFRPWKIAICSLYKKLEFRLIGPIEGRPVMFDDTIYYVSFDTQAEAEATFDRLNSASARSLLSALIFWDEKRPIKTSILNVLDWERMDPKPVQPLLI